MNFSLNSGKIAKLYSIWSKYFEISVYKNEHLKVRLFLFVLGTHLTKLGMRVLYSGRYNTPRVNLFNIQQSGSGKSEAMKSAHFLMKDMGLDGLYLVKTTDASLLGTVILDSSKKPIIRFGELSRRDYLIWDEGSTLMKTGPYSENLQAILQQATDDPGYIEKCLANGVIQYITETSICASSYLDDIINLSLFKNGCLQRMVVSHHEVSDKDIVDFIKHKSKMMSYSYYDKKALMTEFKNELNSIKYDVYDKTADGKRRYIKINPEALDKIGSTISEFVETGQKAFMDDNQRHSILNTFFSRNNHILSVASIVSVINGEKEVSEESLVFGFTIWKDHIMSANSLLMRKIDKTSVTDNPRRLKIIKVCLEKNGPLSKSGLADKLISLESWDLGKSNTYKFINENISEGKLGQEVRGLKNAHTVFWKG